MSLPNGSAYVLHFIFKDGGTGQFTSRDKKSSKSKKRDPRKGLKELMELAKKHEHKAQNIAIYDHQPGTPPDGELVFQWNRGEILLNKIV